MRKRGNGFKQGNWRLNLIMVSHALSVCTLLTYCLLFQRISNPFLTGTEIEDTHNRPAQHMPVLAMSFGSSYISILELGLVGVIVFTQWN